jgi:hypothetical protein
MLNYSSIPARMNGKAQKAESLQRRKKFSLGGFFLKPSGKFSS